MPENPILAGLSQLVADNLYEEDILAWSEQQARLLQRLSDGEPVSAAVDWPNLIGEVSDVGNSALRACRSLLIQALLHDLKSEAWPLSIHVPHWRSEARVARINAADAYAPSMRQKIDIADLYAKALRALPDTVDGLAPLPAPADCPVTLDEMLSAP